MPTATTRPATKAFVFARWERFTFSGGVVEPARVWWLLPDSGERRCLGLAETMPGRICDDLVLTAEQVRAKAEAQGFTVRE
jgi:hypothetical protein